MCPRAASAASSDAVAARWADALAARAAALRLGIALRRTGTIGVGPWLARDRCPSRRRDRGHGPALGQGGHAFELSRVAREARAWRRAATSGHATCPVAPDTRGVRAPPLPAAPLPPLSLPPLSLPPLSLPPLSLPPLSLPPLSLPPLSLPPLSLPPLSLPPLSLPPLSLPPLSLPPLSLPPLSLPPLSLPPLSLPPLSLPPLSLPPLSLPPLSLPPLSLPPLSLPPLSLPPLSLPPLSLPPLSLPPGGQRARHVDIGGQGRDGGTVEKEGPHERAHRVVDVERLDGACGQRAADVFKGRHPGGLLGAQRRRERPEEPGVGPSGEEQQEREKAGGTGPRPVAHGRDHCARGPDIEWRSRRRSRRPRRRASCLPRPQACSEATRRSWGLGLHERRARPPGRPYPRAACLRLRPQARRGPWPRPKAKELRRFPVHRLSLRVHRWRGRWGGTAVVTASLSPLRPPRSVRRPERASSESGPPVRTSRGALPRPPSRSNRPSRQLPRPRNRSHRGFRARRNGLRQLPAQGRRRPRRDARRPERRSRPRWRSCRMRRNGRFPSDAPTARRIRPRGHVARQRHPSVRPPRGRPHRRRPRWLQEPPRRRSRSCLARAPLKPVPHRHSRARSSPCHSREEFVSEVPPVER